MNKNQVFKLIIAIALPLLTGGIAGYFTASEIKDWYVLLNKPSWNPPNYVFMPVWTVLYLLMGYAFFRIWVNNEKSEMKYWAMGLFIVQLALNFLWSFIFFRQHNLGWAAVEIIVLWFSILCTIIAFSKIDKPAAWLLVPYISWVTFATILNFTILQLNVPAK